MNLDGPQKIIFEIGPHVQELLRQVPYLTHKDVESMTEQVIWDFNEEETLHTTDMANLEIEKLPNSYKYVRDAKESENLRDAFKSYYASLRALLISFGMEKAFESSGPGCAFKEILPSLNKMVLILFQ